MTQRNARIRDALKTEYTDFVDFCVSLDKATDSKTPNAWSTVHGIPILCMFTDESIRAQRIFDALNETSFLPNEQSIDDAIEFIESGKLKVLSDISLP